MYREKLGDRSVLKNALPIPFQPFVRIFHGRSWTTVDHLQLGS